LKKNFISAEGLKKLQKDNEILIELLKKDDDFITVNILRI